MGGINSQNEEVARRVRDEIIISKGEVDGECRISLHTHSKPLVVKGIKKIEGTFKSCHYKATGVLKKVKIDNTKDGGVRWKIGRHFLVGLSDEDKNKVNKEVTVDLLERMSSYCYTCSEHRTEMAHYSLVYEVINMKMSDNE